MKSKRLSSIKSTLVNFEKSSVRSWIDRVRFVYILLVWLAIIAAFGGIYHVAATDDAHLFDTYTKMQVTDPMQALYFSFVTATTTGFGDIIPRGHFRSIAIVEVIFGLLLLAIVTSKLVSIKQNMIMKELYEISLHEQMSRLRSELFTIRQHFLRLSKDAKRNKLQEDDLSYLTAYFSTLEDVLIESNNLIRKDRQLGTIELDLLAKSLISTFVRTEQTLDLLKEKNIAFTIDLTPVLDVAYIIYRGLLKSNLLRESTKEVLEAQYKSALDNLSSIYKQS